MLGLPLTKQLSFVSNGMYWISVTISEAFKVVKCFIPLAMSIMAKAEIYVFLSLHAKNKSRVLKYMVNLCFIYYYFMVTNKLNIVVV